jgi:hypothetical protein
MISISLKLIYKTLMINIAAVLFEAHVALLYLLQLAVPSSRQANSPPHLFSAVSVRSEAGMRELAWDAWCVGSAELSSTLKVKGVIHQALCIS